MPTYRVDTSHRTIVVLKADYFQMIYDGTTDVDAQFFIKKEIPSPLGNPPTYENVLVHYVKHPLVVETLDEEPQDG